MMKTMFDVETDAGLFDAQVAVAVGVTAARVPFDRLVDLLHAVGADPEGAWPRVEALLPRRHVLQSRAGFSFEIDRPEAILSDAERRFIDFLLSKAVV
jgi:hypothetical protein